jgi:protein-S-isoprenylcysteine O-methyltransferase Ste14
MIVFRTVLPLQAQIVYIVTRKSFSKYLIKTMPAAAPVDTREVEGPMNDFVLLILVHQLLFQGLFFAKNVALRFKLGKQIRGKNPEAKASIAFFVFFIGLTFYLAWATTDNTTFLVLPRFAAITLGLLLIIFNMIIGMASLRDLGDSWRVGVIEEQYTQLVDDGIYRFTRNPYFLAYLLMFAAYTVLLQSLLLFVLSFVGFGLVHSMIVKEESYLKSVHGDVYLKYIQRVPRYW